VTPAPTSSRRRRRLLPALPQLLPYLLCIGAFLLVWQLLSAVLGVGRLPGPINVIVDTWDPYISQPFFDDGGTSKGLGWQILISLQRVAVGYGLAAVVGVAIGGALGLNRFGTPTPRPSS
jgi:nitrate/nitrite transport system permease protein